MMVFKAFKTNAMDFFAKYHSGLIEILHSCHGLESIKCGHSFGYLLKHFSVGNVLRALLRKCTTGIAVVLHRDFLSEWDQIINCYRQESLTNNNFAKHSTET